MISSEYSRIRLLLSPAVILRARWCQIDRLRNNLPYTIAQFRRGALLDSHCTRPVNDFFQNLTCQFSELLTFFDSILCLQVALHRFLILKYGLLKLFVTEMYHIKVPPRPKDRKLSKLILCSLCRS